MRKQKLWDKWVEKAVIPTFNLVAEDDFNPDGVLLLAYDMYEDGFKHGLLVAGALAGVLLTGLAISSHNKKKGVTNGTSDDIQKVDLAED